MRKRIIIFIVLIIVLSLLWIFVLNKLFLKIDFANPTVNHFTVVDSKSGKEITSGNNTTLSYLPRGDYFVKFFHDTEITSISYLQNSILPFASISDRIDNSTLSNKPLMYENARFTTPLGDGYIYQDNVTGAVKYIDASGVQDVSKKFAIGTEKGDGRSYNRLVSIHPIKNNRVAIVTTLNVFVINNINSIKQSYSNNIGTPLPQTNFYRSSYNTSDDSVYLLSTNSKDVYRVKLSSSLGIPETVYTNEKRIDNLSASEGKLILYYSNFSTLDQNALKSYSEKYQVQPVIVNLNDKSKKNIGYKGLMYSSLSPDGRYIVEKQKFATVMTIRETDSNKLIATVPSFDVDGAATWHDNVLYIGRDSVVWKYDPTSSSKVLEKVSSVISSITDIRFVDNSLFVTTLDGYTEKIDETSTQKSGQSARIKQLKLATSAHTYRYAIFDSTLLITTQLYRAGLDDPAWENSPEINGLKDIFLPNRTVIVKDTDFGTPTYQYFMN